MQLQSTSLSVDPGQTLQLQNVSWRAFEDILNRLGERRSARIAYYDGMLEIMTPLPDRERSKENIGDLIKALLEELDIEFCTLGSTTFKNEPMARAIEPDNCFYIENEAAVRSKDRIDLSVDPPPDLALEIDITSRTYTQIYATLGVRELWQFARGNLQILRLQQGKYIESATSGIFPDFSIAALILDALSNCKSIGRNRAIRKFRDRVREIQDDRSNPNKL